MVLMGYESILWVPLSIKNDGIYRIPLDPYDHAKDRPKESRRINMFSLDGECGNLVWQTGETAAV